MSCGAKNSVPTGEKFGRVILHERSIFLKYKIDILSTWSVNWMQSSQLSQTMESLVRNKLMDALRIEKMMSGT